MINRNSISQNCQQNTKPTTNGKPGTITTYSNEITGTYNQQIFPHHYREMVEGSGIDPELVLANLRSHNGSEVFDLLYPKPQRYHNGNLTKWYVDNLNRVRQCAWWSLANLTADNEPTYSAQFKPDNPELVSLKTDKKPRKYQNPEGLASPLIRPLITPKIREIIAKRNKIEIDTAEADLRKFVNVVVITEGGKKVLAVLTAGVYAFGFAGCDMGFAPKSYETITLDNSDDSTTKKKNRKPDPMVKTLSPEFRRELNCYKPGTVVVLMFDKDSKQQTIDKVDNAIIKKVKSMNDVRPDLEYKIAVWDNTFDGKGIDDVLVNHGINRVLEIIGDAVKFDDWFVSCRLNRATKLTIPDDAVILDQRYMSIEAILDIDPIQQILPNFDNQEGFTAPRINGRVSKPITLVKSQQNTGKTTIEKQIIAAQKHSVIAILSRIELGRDICTRLDGRLVTEDDGNINVLEHRLTVLCWDSLLKIDLSKLDGQPIDIWLDEAIQGLNHLLFAATQVKKFRAAIINKFAYILYYVVCNGGSIRCYDADLNDSMMQFLKICLGLYKTEIEEKGFDFDAICSPRVVVNHRKITNSKGGKPVARLLVEQSQPTAIVESIIEAVSEGKKVLAAVTAAKKESPFSAYNIANLLRKLFPGIRVAVVISDTVTCKDDVSFRCTGHINSFVVNFDVVLFTSTMETGVSIDVKHFDIVFGIFSGVHGVDTIIQMLMRCRDLDIPRVLWVRRQGRRYEGSSQATDAKDIERRVKSSTNNLLKLVGDYADLEDYETVNNNLLKLWSELAVKRNLETKHYAEQVAKRLIDKGFELELVTADDIRSSKVFEIMASHELGDTKAALKEISIESSKEENREIVAATILTTEELAAIENSKSLTRKQKQQIHKTKVSNDYGVVVTENLVAHDKDKDWVAKVRNHYNATCGFDFVIPKQYRRISYNLSANEGRLFQPDIAIDKRYLKPKLLREILMINELISLREITENNPVIELVCKNVEVNKKILFDVFGDSFGRQTKVSTIKAILKVVGLNIIKEKRLNINGKRIQQWSAPAAEFETIEVVKKGKKLTEFVLDENKKAIPLKDEREDYFDYWLHKDKTKEEETKEKREQWFAKVREIKEQKIKAQITEAVINTAAEITEAQELSESEMVANLIGSSVTIEPDSDNWYSEPDSTWEDFKTAVDAVDATKNNSTVNPVNQPTTTEAIPVKHPKPKESLLVMIGDMIRCQTMNGAEDFHFQNINSNNSINVFDSLGDETVMNLNDVGLFSVFQENCQYFVKTDTISDTAEGDFVVKIIGFHDYSGGDVNKMWDKTIEDFKAAYSMFS